MLPFSETAAARIRFLLHSAADSDPQTVVRELCGFAEHGYEGSILLMQGCLDQIDYHGGAALSVAVEPHAISTIFRFLLGRPNFCSVFSGALRTTWDNDSFLANLSKALKLSTCERIAVGLACSESFEFRARGQSFCIAEIEELCASHGESFPSELIQEILMFLSQSEGLRKYIDPFVKMLSLLRDDFPFVLTPMISEDFAEEGLPRQLKKHSGCFISDFDNILSEMEKDMSVADIMVELGYGCTVDTLHCKEILSLFLPLTEITISRILTVMMQTLTGFTDTQTTYSTFSAVLSISQSADSSYASSWNIGVLVDTILQLAPETNWESVIKSLDHEGFYIPDEEAFSFLMSVYSIACKDLFPLNAICGSLWKNVDGQISFLRHAVTASSDVFTFAHTARKLPYVESLQPPNAKDNQAWFCLDLLEILCQLAERGCAVLVREIIDSPLRQLPEILLLGISHCHTAYNLLQQEIASTVFPELLKNPTKVNVIQHIWDANSSIVLREFVDALTVNPDCILKILDLCEELKILVTVLDSAPFSASVTLAAFAFEKDLIDLDKWLRESLNLYKDAFYEACLQFLKNMLPDVATDSSSDSFQRSASVNGSQRSLSVFFKVLQSHLGLVRSKKISEEMRRLSSLLSVGLQNAGAMEMPAGDGSTDDVETEANAYFHQMFSGQLGIDNMVQMLGRFKESAENREQRIYECMISNLFEEYKFFPKYPDKQLKIAAVLFGSLIKNQLVTHLTLGIALRCVLDALRKSVDSKMFLFGAKALEQFIDRLIEWPQYCNHILQISHLRTTHADLVTFIERALARISSSQIEFGGVNNNHIELQQDSPPASLENAELANMGATQPAQQFLQIQQRHQVLDDRIKSSVTSSSQMKTIAPLSGQASLAPSDTIHFQKATTLQSSQASQFSTNGQTATSSSPGFLRPSRASTPAGMLRQSSYSTGFGAALNIETLVAAAERRDTPIEAPASEIQDKIFFMINNISAANMEAKAKEFIEVLKEQHYPWFAQYMVMKRASIEPNFHDLYLKFLDKVNSRSLNKEIVKATYENCKVLLRSDLIKSSSEERSLLKNLGSWLGKFTIGRNQALRAREIDPKLLIIEAYEKGLMIAVIPFTSKILEPCQCSLAYQPPNPWTMAILGLLVEIYNLPNLKMNLKFDIEVLFKNLGVDLKDVKPTSLLKDRVREVEGNPDFSNKDISASQTLVISESNAGVMPALSAVELQHLVSGTTHPGVNAINQYASSLHLPSNTQGDDDKLETLSITERAVSGQGQSQIAPSQSSFSANQILSSTSNFSQHIVVNTKLNALGFQMQLQRIIPMAIERAVREILTPVVQRSVTIASQTTKELAMKDYAMESDEGRIRNAAHLMVTSLAASLAHVTCKEPLRVALSNHLRSYIQALSVSGDLLEQAVQLVTNDNLDLACALIEQAATEKGLQTIDGEIGPSIAFRRKQREAAGSAYYDSTIYAQGPFARVPEALRPKPGRLSNLQQRVYEEFVKYPWHNQSSHSPSVMSTPASVSSSGASINSSLPRISGGGSVQLNSGIYPAPVTGPGFGGANQPSDLISEEMDSVSSQILSVSTSQMPTNDIAQKIQDTSSAISQSPLSSADLLVAEASSMSKEFGAVMPSSAASSERSGFTSSDSVLSTGDALDKYQIVVQKLEGFISKDARDGDIQGIVSEVLEILSKCVNHDEAAMAFAQKAFKCLYDNPSNAVHTSAYLTFLASIRDVCKNIVKELTNWVIYLDDERKFNIDIMLGLNRSELLNVSEFGLHLSKNMDGGRNKTATEFSISLIKSLLVQEPDINLSEFHDVIEVLSKLAMRPGSSESLQQLLEVAVTRNNNAVPISNADVVKDTKLGRELKISASRSAMNMDGYTAVESTGVDSPGFADQVALLFNEWIRINELPVNEAACTHYLSQLQQNGLLKGDDQMDCFFYSLMELAVGHCVASEKPGPLSLQPSQQAQILSFLAIDIYAKLIVSILKFCSPDQATKVVLFSKILSVIVRCVLKDAEERKSLFNPRPYFRLFINLLLDLTTPDPALDSVQFVVLTYFANAFHALQPLKAPGWSFAWLELISHRNFMPRLLLSNNQKGWPFFQRLLVDLFKFMEPYLRNADLPEPVQFLYKGTLRVLLVLLHDFPEFLCEYHFSFCDVIPPSCIQMRNVILSAFPVNMRLPDPCTPNLKIDLLPEINQPPRILSEIDNALKVKQIKVDIDEYLKTRRQDSSFLVELKQNILLSPHEVAVAGTRYNVPFINSLILYVGMQTILQHPKLPSPHIPSSQVALAGADIVVAAVDIYNIFVLDTDSEGRYHFLNAVANQLRYPNNHTHYFSCILLYLFAESNQDVIREQITRVLLERLIVNRPHPWGLLITFIELIKNPRYNFWKQSFIHCAPDIEKLFESVSRSCGASRGIDEGLVSGLSDGSH